MTKYLYDALEPEIAALCARATIRLERAATLRAAANRLLRDKATYLAVEKVTGVPAAAVMALAEREMAGRLDRYLGNGQPLSQRTTIVPIGRGPFDSFVAGCVDAFRIHQLDKVAASPGGWTAPRFCFETEAWNGFGYRMRGLPSPYVFGGTAVQRLGKFVRDGVFDPNHMDEQLGTLAIVEAIVEIDPTLAFFDLAPAPASSGAVLEVSPPPVIDGTDAEWLQISLNILRVPGTPLRIDGSYGRNTALAVANFQRQRHLLDDGLAGPTTVKEIRQALAENGR